LIFKNSQSILFWGGCVQIEIIFEGEFQK